MGLPVTRKVFAKGGWPRPVTFRRGWSRAEARRWNDDYRDAHLRLVRGGPSFIESCAAALLDLGAPSVLSPPLPTPAQRTWRNSGFLPDLELALLRADLYSSIPAPDHLVVETSSTEVDELIAIDRAAFEPFWRLDRTGLLEAIEATPNSRVFVIRQSEGRPAAFFILGIGHALAYLQRLAVHPDWQGQGMGRSLVRAAGRHARSGGARGILLNTQFDNEPAIALYRDEGYTILPDPLVLMRYPA
jgi:ribosomal protein S18 acetylase RimI-like enzyme